MKKFYFAVLVSAFLSQILFAQQAAKTTVDFKAYQEQRLKETDEQHRMAKTYFGSTSFDEMFAAVAKKAGVSEADNKPFYEMIREKYSYKDKPRILDKINRGELNDANVAAFKDGLINEYASYYKGAYLQGKTTLLGDNAPKIKNTSPKEFEEYLSSRLGTNVVLTNNCGNSDFETGSFSGWFNAKYAVSSAFGCGAGTPNPMPNTGFNFTGVNVTGNEHGLCTTAGGNDVSVTAGTLPCVSPFNGGTYSARIGDVTDGCGAAQMSFSFVVGAQQTNFTYSYAAVLYDGHVAADAPKIIFDMIDLTTGQPIGCAHYYIDATQAGVNGSGYLPAFTGSTSLYYKPWSLVFVPLTSYVGKPVQMNIETTDCDGGAHRGYAYFDASCAPFQITLNNFNPCGGGSAVIVAPGGAATYAWTTTAGGTISGSTTTQSVTATTSGDYHVTMTSFGSGCSYTLDTTITISNSPAPVASFSATTACIGSPNTFTDSSYANGGGPITTWAWSFGDGGTSATQSPTHTYATAGTYTVTLTVTNGGGCTSTYTVAVTVNSTLVPTFTAPPVCAGQPTVFTNTTAGAVTYSWTFGDGGTSSIASPTNTYSAAGSYVVTLSVTTSSGCSGSGTITAVVNPIPTLDPMPNIGVCDQSQVVVNTFTSSPVGASVAWTNSNTTIGLAGSGAGNIAPFTGSTNGSGTLNVGTVSATPTLNGCVGPPITFNIAISPQPTITIASPAPFCPGDVVAQPVINSNPPGATYVWMNNNIQIGLGGNGIGVPPQFNALPNPNFTLNNVTGVITVTPAIGTCVGLPTTYTIVVKPTPIVNPTPNPDYCPSVNTQQVNFTASPGGGTPTFFWSATNTGIGILASGNGSVNSFSTINSTNIDQSSTVQVYATLNNCPGPISTFIITVDPNPTALFSANSKICEGAPMSFTDQSFVGSGQITQWGWDFNNDGVFTDASAQNPQYILTPAGSHTVGLQVTTAKGCKNSITEPVYINYNPTPAFVGDVLTGCPVHPVNYTESSIVTAPAVIVSWNWSFGNGQTATTQTVGTVFYDNSSPVQSAFYTASLTVTTDSGCVGSLTKNNYITVYPHPLPGFNWGPQDPDPDVMNPVVYFTDQSQGASGPNSYGPNGMLWYLGDVFLFNPANNYVNNVQNPVHTYENYDPYIYYVTQWVQNTYGCKDSITKPVEIKPTWTFYIPNAFSPNGDGRNEGFKGTGIGIDNTTYNLWIFDRWGMQIFYANDIEKTWDGHIQGKSGTDIVQEDVYVWKVKFHDFTGRKHEYKGTVSVIK